MDSNKTLLLALLVLKKGEVQKAQAHRMKIRKIRKHRFWVRKILTERKWKGEYCVLVNELKLFDHEFFYKQFGMSTTRYEELLKLVALLITKSSERREVVSPGERLCITLRSLCSGDSNTTIACLNYIKAPHKEEWRKIAEEFETSWNFPNCIGAIDGKHIVIQAPPRSGSTYFNYKKPIALC